MTYYLYGLTEPNNKEYKYIGVTANPKHRLAQHIAGHKQNPLLSQWVLDLKSKGLKPQLKIIRKIDCFNTCVVRDLEKKYIQEHKPTLLNQTKDCDFVQNYYLKEYFSYIKHTGKIDKMIKAITTAKGINFSDILAYCIEQTYSRLNEKEIVKVNSEGKLYTAKQLSILLNISVQRFQQLFEKHISKTDLILAEYEDHSGYPKKYTEKTLRLLKKKQEENSKFQRFRK